LKGVPRPVRFRVDGEVYKVHQVSNISEEKLAGNRIYQELRVIRNLAYTASKYKHSRLKFPDNSCVIVDRKAASKGPRRQLCSGWRSDAPRVGCLPRLLFQSLFASTLCRHVHKSYVKLYIRFIGLNRYRGG
jgi:hypothetical protein